MRGYLVADGPKEPIPMKRILTASIAILFAVSLVPASQEANSNASKTSAQSSNSNKKRNPIFRANKDQIRQAQAILKQRGFYSGEQTGKLDPDTRAGLRKYPAAEKIKVTGTLNKLTLEKMNIPLTEKQKA
jgi:peptidoglycan hydrolase-like protein with peptidoglycan-binding domain